MAWMVNNITPAVRHPLINRVLSLISGPFRLLLFRRAAIGNNGTVEAVYWRQTSVRHHSASRPAGETLAIYAMLKSDSPEPCLDRHTRRSESGPFCLRKARQPETEGSRRPTLPQPPD